MQQINAIDFLLTAPGTEVKIVPTFIEHRIMPRKPLKILVAYQVFTLKKQICMKQKT